MSVDTTNALPTKPKEYDEKGDLIVELSPRAVATIRELNGRESLGVDKMAGGSLSSILIGKLYGLLGLRSLKIDGKAVELRDSSSDLNVNFRAQYLTGRELLVLAEAYAGEFMSDPFDEDALKNS
jgi:hypothetical protein